MTTLIFHFILNNKLLPLYIWCRYSLWIYCGMFFSNLINRWLSPLGQTRVDCNQQFFYVYRRFSIFERKLHNHLSLFFYYNSFAYDNYENSENDLVPEHYRMKTKSWNFHFIILFLSEKKFQFFSYWNRTVGWIWFFSFFSFILPL